MASEPEAVAFIVFSHKSAAYLNWSRFLGSFMTTELRIEGFKPCSVIASLIAGSRVLFARVIFKRAMYCSTDSESSLFDFMSWVSLKRVTKACFKCSHDFVTSSGSDKYQSFA